MFETSKQFWTYLVEQGHFDSPRSFINPVPHLSFVRGDKDISFLRKRFEALSANPLFAGMEYTEDRAKLEEWMPLMMKGRTTNEKIAATRTESGTDVNFGALTLSLIHI